MKSVLSNGSFLKIWSGQLVSQIGDKFYAIALAVWIVDKTGSPRTMAVFLVASMLPGLLAGPYTGALADRWNRRTIMIAADLARAAVVLGVSLLSAAGSLGIPHVVAAAVAISLASAFFSPALAASLPRIVGEKKVGEANALSQLGGGITTVLGPACGAIVLGFLGYEAVFAVNAASFLVSGILVALSRVPLETEKARKGGLAASIAEGMRFAWRDRGIVVVFALIMLAHFCMGGLSVALPFLAKSLIGSGARNLGFLEASLGAGMTVGAITAAALAGRTKSRGLFLAFALMGAGLAAAGFLETARVVDLLPYLACSAGIGASVATAATFWTTILQKGTPNALRGRVFGLSTTLGNASLPVGIALTGFALDRISFGTLFGPGGAVLFLTALLLTFAGRRTASEVKDAAFKAGKCQAGNEGN